jgi:hypothetical protein
MPRLSPAEEQWLGACWGLSQRDNDPVFGRLDAMVDFVSPMWKDSRRLLRLKAVVSHGQNGNRWVS